MPNKPNQKTDRDQAMVYQIRLVGHLGREWTDWFGHLTITLEDNGDTLLTGPVVDQAALHGLLRKVRDLGMPLVSVIRVEPGQAGVSDVKQSTAKAKRGEESELRQKNRICQKRCERDRSHKSK